MNAPKAGLFTIHVQISLCRDEAKELISTPLREAATKAWSKMLLDRLKAAAVGAGVFSDQLPSISEALYSESISLVHVSNWQKGAAAVRAEIESLGLLEDSRIGWIDPEEGVCHAVYPHGEPAVQARTFLEKLKENTRSKEAVKSLKLLGSLLGKKAK